MTAHAALLLVGFALGFVASGLLNDVLARVAERVAARLPSPAEPFDYDRALEQARDSAMQRAQGKGMN